MNMNKQFTVNIDFESADKITSQVLEDYRDVIELDLARHKQGGYLNEEDVKGHKKRLKALNLIIADFMVVK